MKATSSTIREGCNDQTLYFDDHMLDEKKKNQALVLRGGDH